MTVFLLLISWILIGTGSMVFTWVCIEKKDLTISDLLFCLLMGILGGIVCPVVGALIFLAGLIDDDKYNKVIIKARD